MVEHAESVPRITLPIRRTSNFGRLMMTIVTACVSKDSLDCSARLRDKPAVRNIASMVQPASLARCRMELPANSATVQQPVQVDHRMPDFGARPSHRHSVPSCPITMGTSFVSTEASEKSFLLVMKHPNTQSSQVLLLLHHIAHRFL